MTASAPFRNLTSNNKGKKETKMSKDFKTDGPLPRDFEEKAKQRFEKLTKPEVTFEQHLEHEKAEFHRQQALAQNPSLTYQPSIGTMTPCGNGDFEKTLDAAEWQGAYGSLPGASGLPSTTPINFGSFTTGISSGGISSSLAHQTWVGAGTDPNVGIPTTAQGSSGAVGIGNAVNGYGCELLSKTFIV